MKPFILTLVILFAACTQFNSPTLSKDEEQKRIAEAQTENVINAIKQKPEWLFSNNDVCPADIIGQKEVAINYLSVGCADNPDKCLENCRKDDGNACYALALLIQDKYGVEQNDSETLFLRSCKLGVTSGCTNRAAGMMNLEKMDDSKMVCAANTFEKACSKNDSWGCTMYGFMLYEGNGRKQNKDEAIKILRKACDETNDDDPACQRAKEMEQMYKNPPQKAAANANNQK